MFSSSSIAKKIRHFPGKILIIWGEDDTQMTIETPQALLSIRSDAHFVSLPKTGHLPHQERPKETAEAIMQFNPLTGIVLRKYRENLFLQ